MVSIDVRQEANNLREEKKYDAALPLYEQLWLETADQYDGAGLLRCLRKLKRYDKATPLADEMVNRFPDFQWARNEAIWTYIEGKLNNIEDGSPVAKIIEVANNIFGLSPKGFATKMVVFKVVKAAKAAGDWQIVDEWTNKLNPETLSNAPMTDEEGREGWSDQSLWYNYRVRAMVETDKAGKVLEFIDEVINKFPRQKKFFLRLKALSLIKLHKPDDAHEIYRSLCNVRKPDWWLLHEYANILKDKNQEKEALRVMCQAAASHKKLEAMVTLFKDIGLLCKEIDLLEEARAHLVLSSLIRTEKGWAIPISTSHAIKELNSLLNNQQAPSSIRDALTICRKIWSEILDMKTDHASTTHLRNRKRGLIGKLLLGKPNVSFCFIINDDNTSYFCQKSNLPAGIANGETVTFTALPSFDKKKNTEAWKAVDIRKME
jgi:tetratricopeptide (TPR) repeat protein